MKFTNTQKFILFFMICWEVHYGVQLV